MAFPSATAALSHGRLILSTAAGSCAQAGGCLRLPPAATVRRVGGYQIASGLESPNRMGLTQRFFLLCRAFWNLPSAWIGTAVCAVANSRVPTMVYGVRLYSHG